MNAAAVFAVVNLAPLPIWALWVLAPRSAVSRQLAQSLWPWQLLAGVYLAALTIAVALSPAPASFEMGSLAGVMRSFAQEWAALAGWVHYLCFDLFVARWILNDAPDGGYRLAPVFLLTLFAGPVGLLAYTFGRRWFRGAGAAAA